MGSPKKFGTGAFTLDKNQKQLIYGTRITIECFIHSFGRHWFI